MRLTSTSTSSILSLRLKPVAVIATSALLAACGGGGGGSAGGSVSITPTAVLNSSNQTVVSQDTSSSSFVPLAGSQTLTGVVPTDASALFSLAQSHLDRLPTYIADAHANSTLAGVVQSQTVACTTSGSMTVSVNDSDNSGTATAGDSISITSNSCVEGSGTISGSLSFVINSLTGTLGSSNYSASMTMTFGNFGVAAAQFTATANGALTIAIASNGTYSNSTTVSTPSLSVAANYSGNSRSMTLTNYSATRNRTPSQTYVYTTSYSLNGYLTSSSISSQAIQFATTTPFVTRYTDNYPSSGVMVITGANSSKIRLTALSNSQVSQELDANGDGTYESSATVSWSSLM